MNVPNVKILVTSRDREILKGSTLVFDTLRIGYPTAHVTVYLNNIEDKSCEQDIRQACEKAEVDKIIEIKNTTIHHVYLETLVNTEEEPFVALDTDIIFWDKCEEWSFFKPLAGRLIPEFWDDFTNCITRPRLHGSHLWVRPAEVRKLIEDYRKQFPVTPFNPGLNLFHPCYYPFILKGKTLNFFCDTACLLYQAVGGDAFEEKHLNCFDHLNAGTISDLVAPRLPDIRLREAHFAIFENPNLARGAWRQQNKYYAAKKP